MTVVHMPPGPHHCGPNTYGHWLDHWDDPAGTVRQCPDCGRSWVAYRPYPASGYMGVLWRREGWLAHWRRVRRTGLVTDR